MDLSRRPAPDDLDPRRRRPGRGVAGARAGSVAVARVVPRSLAELRLLLTALRELGARR